MNPFEENATQQAEKITEAINAQIKKGAKVGGTRTEKIKEAYLQFNKDQAAFEQRKKALIRQQQSLQAWARKPKSNKEEKIAFLKEKSAVEAEQQALKKEVRGMNIRRDESILSALTGRQQGYFQAIRAAERSPAPIAVG